MASKETQPIPITQQDFVKQFRSEWDKPDGKLGYRVLKKAWSGENGDLAPTDQDIMDMAGHAPGIQKKYKIITKDSPPPEPTQGASKSSSGGAYDLATTPLSSRAGMSFREMIKRDEKSRSDKATASSKPFTGPEKFMAQASEEAGGILDDMTSPLGIVTLGFGPKLRALAAAGEASKVVKALGWAEKGVRAAFSGSQVMHAAEAVSAFHDDPSPENAARAVMSGAFAVGAMAPEVKGALSKGVIKPPVVAESTEAPPAPQQARIAASQAIPQPGVVKPDDSGTIRVPESRRLNAAPPPPTVPPKALPPAPRVFNQPGATAPPDSSGVIKGWQPTTVQATWDSVQKTLRHDPYAVKEYISETPEQLQQTSQKLKYLRDAAKKVPGELMPAPKGVTPQSKEQFVQTINRHIEAVDKILGHFTPQDQSAPPPPSTPPVKGK